MQSSNNPDTTMPSTENMTPVTESQKAEAIRDFLFKQFNEKYQVMAQAFNQAPLNSILKDKAISFLDTGYLWAKEAFVNMSFAPPPQVVGTVTPEQLQNNIVEMPRKKRKYTVKNKKNGKRKST